MELNATTFILELINFAVLVWLLNRFLFRPVMAVMDKRRAEIDKQTQNAQKLRNDADGLRAQYEGRLTDWEKEEDAARVALARELDAQRTKGIEDARAAAAQETQRLAAAEDKKRADWQRGIELRALKQGAAFAAKFLQRLGGPELDAKLVEAFLADLAALPPEQASTLTAAARDNQGRVSIASARPLPPALRQAIERGLAEKLGVACKADYVVDNASISGLRVTLGPWVLQADIKDELAFFAAGAQQAA